MIIKIQLDSREFCVVRGGCFRGRVSNQLFLKGGNHFIPSVEMGKYQGIRLVRGRCQC